MKVEFINGREPFEELFRRRLNEIERDAHEAGLSITAICRETGISRATPDRWRKDPPKTIALLDDMEKALVKLKKAKAKKK